ncbi:MAG: ion transporter, partial [Trueperaceae bacterium]
MSLRDRIGNVIFEVDTPVARAFDAALLIAIVASVIAVLLESVAGVRARYGAQLRAIEWAFTVAFTIEYAARIWTAREPLRYVRSFYGLIDLVAIVPTYLTLLFAGSHYLVVVRALRILRVFRILKAARYVGEAGVLARALRASSAKIVVFLVFVFTMVLISGAVMHLVEGRAHGFDNIPLSMYWAIVTLTTVGYGDLAPVTNVGRTLASLLMVLGYGVIAVPTGIVTSELARSTRPQPQRIDCPSCGTDRHEVDAAYCRVCGHDLRSDDDEADEVSEADGSEA